VFDDDHAGVSGGVVDDVGDLGDLFAMQDDNALGRGDGGDAGGVEPRLCGDADGLIDGVGEQALLGGMDGIEQAFATEVAVLDDGE
jgi:hypothetical protein